MRSDLRNVSHPRAKYVTVCKPAGTAGSLDTGLPSVLPNRPSLPTIADLVLT